MTITHRMVQDAARRLAEKAGCAIELDYNGADGGYFVLPHDNILDPTRPYARRWGITETYGG